MKMAIVLFVLILGGISAVKTGLSFADKGTLVSMLDNVDRIEGLSEKNEKEIKEHIIIEASRNKIDYIEPEDINVKISRSSGYIEVDFNYISRVDLLPGVGFDMKMNTEPKRLAD
jgi:hypothetical protein